MSYKSDVDRLAVEVGDLLAQHEKTRDLADFARYADDPAGFMREVLHCLPWSKQDEMAEWVRDNPRVVVVTCNGLGKDWMTARIALWWVYARGGLCILTGPTERQVKHILMRQVRQAFNAAPELPGELYSMELRVGDSGDSGILAFTSDQADRLTGFHHPLLAVFITEGQGVEDDAYEAAMSCLTGAENRLFVYGNPTRPTGSFYRIAHSDNWHAETIAAPEHPNVISGREEIPGAITREWIAGIREEYGEASSIYGSRVLARFPSEAIEGLIRRAWLNAAVAKWNAPHPSEAHLMPWSRSPVTLGVDVGRMGPDASVVAVARRGRVEEIVMWRGAETTESVDRVIAVAKRVQPVATLYFCGLRIVVDAVGVGAGVHDGLKAKGWPVVEYNGGASPEENKSFSDSRRFANRRAETHWRFRESLERGLIELPQDDALFEEALAVEWQINPAGKIQILGKDLIRKSLGRSPDRLDAVTMALEESMDLRLRPTISFYSIEI